MFGYSFFLDSSFSVLPKIDYFLKIHHITNLFFIQELLHLMSKAKVVAGAALLIG